MTKRGVFGASESLIFFIKNWDLRGNSKIIQSNPYLAIPIFRGIDLSI